VAFTLATAAAYSRDYQDSWILEGLEIHFMIVMITYVIYFVIERKISWILVFALVIRSFILLLPNLKYIWFQGVAIDQQIQYRLAKGAYNGGYILEGYTYSDTPGMHLSFTILSIITGIPIWSSLKYLPIIFWLIYPLVIYLIIKNSLKLISVTDSSIVKNALFISSIPVKAVMSYLVTGVLFGSLFILLILSQLIGILERKSRRNWIIAIIYGFALTITHTVSSLTLTGALLSIYLTVEFFRIRKRVFASKTFVNTIAIIAFINILWVSKEGTSMLERIIEAFSPYIARISGAQVNPGQPVPPRFFEIGILDGLRVILVLHGADILLMFLTLIGVMVAVKRLRSKLKPGLMLLFLYLTSTWLIMIAILIVLRIGLQWYDRAIAMTSIIFPIFSGISLYYIDKKIRRKVSVFLILLTVLLATIQLYQYQPLIPSSSAFSADLPVDEPILYINNVVSIYQRQMLKFAEKSISGSMKIASDRATQTQIIGLTDYEMTTLVWYYPLSTLSSETKFDYFLIHLPGKSGVFEEKAEMRTRSLILEAIYNSSIIYSNGESYILADPFMYFANSSSG